jgi:hypothetical protein
MNLKSVWLSGAAVSALLAALTPLPAAADPIPRATSYAELLDPVPDAEVRLAADDALREQAPRLQVAQYWEHHHHHHHHHSWQWYRDNGYFWDGGAWALIPNYHHHHAWAWYRARGYYWNGWAWVPRAHHHHHHHHHHDYRPW